jgi:hypothetical protein
MKRPKASHDQPLSLASRDALRYTLTDRSINIVPTSRVETASDVDSLPETADNDIAAKP